MAELRVDVLFCELLLVGDKVGESGRIMKLGGKRVSAGGAKNLISIHCEIRRLYKS